MEASPKPNFLYDLVLPKVEWIGWMLALLGLGLRWVGLSGGSIMLMIGLSTLALLFYVRTFQPAPPSAASASASAYAPVTLPAANASFFTLIATKIQGIAGAVVLIGVLFKLLFWQGSAPLLLVGTLTLGPLAVWQLATRQLQWRVAVVTFLGLSAWLTPTEALVRQFYRDDPALVAALLYKHQHPHDRAAAQQVRHLLQARQQRSR